MSAEKQIEDIPLFPVSAFDDNLPFEFGGGYSEFDTISPEDILMSNYQNEPVFRCSTLLAPAPAPDAFETFLDRPAEYILERPSLKRGASKNAYSVIDSSSVSFSVLNVTSAQTCGGFQVPEIPLLLMPTHFEVDTDIDTLVYQVDEILNSVPGVNFTYNRETFEWNVSYLNGPSHCKIQIHIYSGFTAGFIVEGNRLNGDSSLFRSLYSQLKMDMCLEDGSMCYDSFTVFTPLPTPPQILPSSSDLHGLGPIFRMAQSPYMEAQLEASRTLCEYSNEESMRAQMVSLGCLSVLMDLLKNSPSEWVQQHALLAMANFSDCHECREAIIASGVASLLVKLCCDGTYQTAEVRVLGAYILANIACHSAEAVVSMIGQQAVSAWMVTVDSLADERVRLHSSRARDALVACV